MNQEFPPLFENLRTIWFVVPVSSTVRMNADTSWFGLTGLAARAAE